jgi:hypothetical protein
MKTASLPMGIVLLGLAVGIAEIRARDPSEADEKPRDARIRILNACDTVQPERWRTGLDLRFRDRTIGRDIRIGERGPSGRISFTGKDVIEVARAGGDGTPIASVPARLKPSGRYSLVVMGWLDADSSDLDVRVVEEYPIPEQSIRPQKCRIQLLNAVRGFPVGVEINGVKIPPLAYGEIRELFLHPGEPDIGLLFSDADGVTRRMQCGMRAQPGDNFTAVIHPSSERSDRPAFFRVNAAAERGKKSGRDE